MIINDDCGYIYTNNLDPFNELIASSGVLVVDIRSAQLDRPRDTMVIKNSVHEQRTYFRNQSITAEQKKDTIKFLSNRSEIRTSPSMTSWLHDFPQHRYVCDNYFLKDSDTESPILNEESVSQLQAVFEQLAGAGVLIEIEEA